MLIYLDLCCLKRPFDDQSQPRIRLETEAVLHVMALESRGVQFVRSVALLVENDFNPVRERAERIVDWLESMPVWTPPDSSATDRRITELRLLGLKAFDALHLATAEQAGADRFATTDDRFIKAAARRTGTVKTVACSILDVSKELLT